MKKHKSKTKKRFKNHKFWIKSNPRAQSKYTIRPSSLSTFLKKNNYFIFNQSVIRIKNNIAVGKTVSDIFRDCLEYIERQEIDDLTNDFYRQGETLLISKKGLLFGLKKSKLNPIKDTSEIAFVCFKNQVVKIYADKFELINYKDVKKLNGFIWENSIIQKNFRLEKNSCQMQNFLQKVTNDNEHFNYAKSIIGYLLHKYKDPSNAVAIILSDIKTEASNIANGGSGKGIIMNAISKTVNVVFENGKNINLSSNKFVYQNITENTNIFFLDDVKKNFDFESLFSVITTNMQVEKKGLNPYLITFEFSPKIALTTNYSVRDKGESSRRRKKILFLNNYFNLNHTPKKEFNNMFFDGWDDLEWNCFYNFMLNCIQHYLKYGFVKYNNSNFKYELLISETSNEFVSLIENKHNEVDVFFKLDSITKALNIEPKTSSKWLELYARYKGLIIKKRKITGKTEIKFTKN